MVPTLQRDIPRHSEWWGPLPRHPNTCYKPKPVIESNYFSLCFHKMVLFLF